jgi:hypothetical protein
MKKVLQNRSEEDEKRMLQLEEQLKDARNHAEDADKKYEEVSPESCRGHGLELLGYESGITQRRRTGCIRK